jgi:hypothetical protein
MKTILDGTSGRGRVKPRGQTAGVILVLLLGLGAARADTMGFTGDFTNAFWTISTQSGTVSFANANTELDIVGDNDPPVETKSLEGISYNGPLPGGLAVGGTVQFDYQYTSLDDGNAYAEFSTSVSGTPIYLGNGVATGGVTFFSPIELPQGATFGFLLYTDTDPGKGAASLVITSFQFVPDVPEPTTGVLLGSALISLGAARGWRSRRRASGQR